MSILLEDRDQKIDRTSAAVATETPTRRRFVRDPVLSRRLWRYAVTSVVATVVSEVALLALYGSGLLDATIAAVVANLAGTLPSYLMSRYWIWSEADRRRAVRQVVVYWVISFVSLVASSVATGVAAANAPTGRLVHLAVVGAAYIATYALLWIVKFVVYQRVLFRTPRELPSK